MDRERKTSVICISVILMILLGIPAAAFYVLFCPHTEYFFFDREKLGNDLPYRRDGRCEDSPMQPRGYVYED